MNMIQMLFGMHRTLDMDELIVVQIPLKSGTEGNSHWNELYIPWLGGSIENRLQGIIARLLLLPILSSGPLPKDCFRQLSTLYMWQNCIAHY